MERERRIEAVAAEEFGRPFDLTNELPLRITLIRSSTDEFVLLLVVHHICWDDDSWEVFFRELSAAYNGAQRADRRHSSSRWRCSRRSAEPGHCRRRLLGRDAAARRPNRWSFPGWPPRIRPGGPNAERRALPADLYSRIEDFAREHAASPFMVLLAAYGVLVRRYTGATDFLVSVPVTDRGAAADGRHRILRQHAVAADHHAVAGHLHLVRRCGTRNVPQRVRPSVRRHRPSGARGEPGAHGTRRHGPAGPAGLQHAQERQWIRVGRRRRAPAWTGRGNRASSARARGGARTRRRVRRVRVPDRRAGRRARRPDAGSLPTAAGQRAGPARTSPRQPGHARQRRAGHRPGAVARRTRRDAGHHDGRDTRISRCRKARRGRAGFR